MGAARSSQAPWALLAARRHHGRCSWALLAARRHHGRCSQLAARRQAPWALLMGAARSSHNGRSSQASTMGAAHGRCSQASTMGAGTMGAAHGRCAGTMGAAHGHHGTHARHMGQGTWAWHKARHGMPWHGPTRHARARHGPSKACKGMESIGTTIGPHAQCSDYKHTIPMNPTMRKSQKMG